MSNERRKFLWNAALSAAALAPLQTLARSADKDKDKKDDPGADISPPEDLMREHGVLNRILLVYEEGLRRLHGKEEVGPEVFHVSAKLVRNFVEAYHENSEGKFIFPEFEKRIQMVDLVSVLRKQHKAGRAVTDVVLRVAEPDAFRKEDNRKELLEAVHAFIRMYRPHETREDTVLFPALYKILTEKQIKEVQEKMEEEEKSRFGEGLFEKAVDQVTALEKQLGIYDLDQFTPKTPGK
jgi:hemerythrin-like domain-containing protein